MVSGSGSDRLIETLSKHGEALDGRRELARLFNVGCSTHRRFCFLPANLLHPRLNRVPYNCHLSSSAQHTRELRRSRAHRSRQVTGTPSDDRQPRFVRPTQTHPIQSPYHLLTSLFPSPGKARGSSFFARKFDRMMSQSGTSLTAGFMHRSFCIRWSRIGGIQLVGRQCACQSYPAVSIR